MNHKAVRLSIDMLIKRDADPLFARFRTRLVTHYSRTIFIVRYLATVTETRVRVFPLFLLRNPARESPGGSLLVTD